MSRLKRLQRLESNRPKTDKPIIDALLALCHDKPRTLSAGDIVLEVLRHKHGQKTNITI